MEWVIAIGLFLIGLVLIVKGGDIFVDAAMWLAERTGIPKLIIGATVVSVATTLPEMLVSFFAAEAGKVDMATGNAIGSVTANTGLILGIALICMPSVINRREYWLKSLLMLLAAGVLVLFAFSGSIGAVPNVILIVIFIVFLADNIFQAKTAMMEKENTIYKLSAYQKSTKAVRNAKRVTVRTAEVLYVENVLPTDKKQRRREMFVNVLKFIGGAVFLAVGSRLLVDNGSKLALFIGVPERIIAVTIIAVGTSLPELVTTLTAIKKKQSALSAGNIIGANIIDLSLILPISSLISGKALPVSAQFASVDMPVCLLIALIALIPMLITKKFSRWQGVVMVVLYVVYLIITTIVIG